MLQVVTKKKPNAEFVKQQMQMRTKVHCVQLELCLQQPQSLVGIAGDWSRGPNMKKSIPWIQ